MKKKEIKEQKKESVGYKGKIEVGIIKDGKKYKRFVANTGTLELFKYIAGCISGKVNANYNTNLRPGCIRLYNGDNALLSYGIPMSNVDIEEYSEQTSTGIINEANSYCNVIFDFLIPGTAVYNRTISKVKLTPIADKDATRADPVVYAEATFNIPITITDIDTNVYISWTLTIKNEKV